MTHIRVQPEDGPPEFILEGGSRVTEDELALTLVSVAIAKLRAANKTAPAREISLALTKCEEAVHWLNALNRSAR